MIIAYKELRRIEMMAFEEIEKVSENAQLFYTSISLSQFYGVEIDGFAHRIATLAMWLTEHQMNLESRERFGNCDPTLPLKKGGNIIHGDSLAMDWEAVLPRLDREKDEVYIVGNPPFLGWRNRNDVQNKAMGMIFSSFKNYKKLDFVSSWFYKGSHFIKDSAAKLALVSTNSICQGEQVPILWPEIFKTGSAIEFAYESFQWKNNAKQNAGVHVTILGLSHNPKNCKIYSLGNNQECLFQHTDSISPYLISGKYTNVTSRSIPISNSSPLMHYGNMPIDGGHLHLDQYEKDTLLKTHPELTPYIKKIIGAEELLQDKQRWCLWLVDAPEVIITLPPITEKINKVRELRLKSKSVNTQRDANKAHLFQQISQKSLNKVLIVPRVSSESRDYVPISFNENVVVNDSCLFIKNASLYDFAILSSLMHNDWMRVIAGRLKSDYRYSATLVYNNFIWPEYTPAQRIEIEALAQDILDIREEFFDMTLGDMYHRDKMPEKLKQAHQKLDLAVDQLYRSKPFESASERVEHLFKLYEKAVEKEKQDIKK